MVNGQAQGNARQRPQVTRVSANHGFGIQPSAAGIRDSKYDDQVILAALLDQRLYSLLTIQVKRTCSASGRAINLQHKHRLGSGAEHTSFKRRPVHTFEFSDNDNLLTFEFQKLFSFHIEIKKRLLYVKKQLI